MIRFPTKMVKLEEAAEDNAPPKLRALSSKFDEDYMVLGTFRNQTELIPKKLAQAVTVFVELEESSNRDKRAFMWDFIAYNDSRLELQLFFENPKYVSQGLEPDVLVVKLLDSEVFRDVQGNQIEEWTEVRRPLLS